MPPRIAGIGCVLVALAGVARAAAEDAASAPSTIEVSAEATVTARPDRAEIDVAVVTRAPAAREATADNAARTREVLAALRGSLTPPPHVETVGYVVRPDYTQASSERAATISGYSARTVVRVTVDDVDQVGAIVDQVTRAGADEIAAIRFTVADDARVRTRALREAAAEARAKANAVARSLGLEVVRIRSVTEAAPGPRPVRELAMARTTAAAPIVAGPIETTATVTLTIEVAPAR